jgi:hypothetical protein
VRAAIKTADPAPAERGRADGGLRALAVYERSRNGEHTLREAAEMASGGARLTDVTLAPQAPRARCCGSGSGAYNCAMRDEAAVELRDARRLLGATADRVRFVVLVERRDPPLSIWVAEAGFQVVLVPADRFSRGGGALARSLRRASAADVRLIRQPSGAALS